MDNSQIEAPLATSSQLTSVSAVNTSVDQNESSFDSLPPGEKYHLPPHEQSSSSSTGGDILNQKEPSEQPMQNVADVANVIAEDDPFDTSAIIIPTENVTQPPFETPQIIAHHQKNDAEEKPYNNATQKLPHMLSQLEPFISPKEKTPENNDDFRYVQFYLFRYVSD